MARSSFLGTASDWLFVFATVSGFEVPTTVTRVVTFWDAQAGGNQYTDLLDSDGEAVDSITPPPGKPPETLYGPDGVTEMWADAGAGYRVLVRTSDDAYAAATSAAASASDAAASATAAQAVGDSNDTIVAGLLADSGSDTYAGLNTALDAAVGPAVDEAAATKADQTALDAVTDWDFRKASSFYHATFQLASTTVMQAHAKDPATGLWYVTQASANGSGQDVILSRCTASGRLLDSMTLTLAGHGTNLMVESPADGSTNAVITIAWVGTPNRLVSFTYSAGATLTGSDVTTAWDLFGDTYVVPSYNSAEDYVVYRTADAPDTYYERRKWSEVKAGTDQTYGVKIGPLIAGGFTTIGDYLYHFPAVNDDLDGLSVDRYSWSDGSLVDSTAIPQQLFSDGNGTIDGSFAESEGLSVFTDPATSKLTLFTGVVNGPVGGRRAKIFGWSRDWSTRLIGDQLKMLVPTAWKPLTLTNGTPDTVGMVPSYRLWPNGDVEICGRLTGTFAEGNTTLFTLPAEARPKSVMAFPIVVPATVSETTNAGQLHIDSTGATLLNIIGGGTTVHLDGVRFNRFVPKNAT